MKRIAVMIATLSLATTSWAQGDRTENGRKQMQTANDISMVAPALQKYAQGPLAELWKRPGLTPRDRSIVTIAALIARNQTIEMPHYFNLALDNGVKPREISPDCFRPGRAASPPPQSGHGQRPDTVAGRGGCHPFGLLLRLAECLFRVTGPEGCLRETSSLAHLGVCGCTAGYAPESF